MSLHEQISTFPDAQYAAIDLAITFISVLVHENHQKQFDFSCQGQQYTYISLSQGYINNLTLCHKLFSGDLDCLFHKIL